MPIMNIVNTLPPGQFGRFPVLRKCAATVLSSSRSKMITRLTIQAEEIYSGTTTAGAGSKLHFSFICTENCCIFLFIRFFMTESNILICSSFPCETTSTANMHVTLCACVRARVCSCVCVSVIAQRSALPHCGYKFDKGVTLLPTQLQ